MPHQAEISGKQLIRVEGMTCTNCALSVTKRLEKLGLEEVNTNFLSGEVVFNENNNVSFEVIKGAVESIGYSVVENQEAQPEGGWSKIEKKFFFSLIFTLPLFFHMFLPHTSILQNPIVQLVLCIPVFVVGILHFGKSAIGSLRGGVANMDLLILIGSVAAFVYSLSGTLLFYGTHDAHNYLFFETTATIITLVFLGNVIEHRSVRQTTSAVRDLMKMQEVKAKKIHIHDGEEHIDEIPALQLKVNDVFILATGDRVPTDAEIISGEGFVDESMITGESHPQKKQPGFELTGGTIVAEGNFRARVTKVGKETVLSTIIQLVKNAQAKKPEIQKMSDRISAVFVPIVLIIAAVTFLLAYFFWQHSPGISLLQAIAVLVISCPCAMGLATPTAVVAGLGRAAKSGILIKGADTIERIHTIDTIVFDKTGTLTDGKFTIGEIKNQSSYSESEILRIIYSIEIHSSHPIAKSIVEHLKLKFDAIVFTEVVEEKGMGLKAKTKENLIFQLGSARLLGKNDVNNSGEIFLVESGKLIASVEVKDQLKPDVPGMIRRLKLLNITPVLLSGDHHLNCKRIAEEAGITEWYAEKLPHEKADFISELNTRKKTMMVGDGINDAPALAASEVGVSFGNATQVAINSAQVVLLKPDSGLLLEMISICHVTVRTIRQNLFWAFFYNVVAIPVAAIGWLNPMIAALTMAFSDVIVVGNSIFLKFKKLK